MATARDASPSTARRLLSQAVKDCSDRGLYLAARWAAELLNAVVEQEEHQARIPPEHLTSTPAPAPRASGSNRKRRKRSSLLPSYTPGYLAGYETSAEPIPIGSVESHELSAFAYSPETSLFKKKSAMLSDDEDGDDDMNLSVNNKEDALEESERDLLVLGKAYFDAKELDRCARTLRHCKSSKARFLGLYSRYLASEKASQEAAGPVMAGQKDKMRNLNPTLIPLLEELHGCTDPWLLYLNALILDKVGKRKAAMDCLMQSGNKYPYNWSGWLKLATLIDRADEFAVMEDALPDSFMAQFFSIHAVLEIHSASEALQPTVESLLKVFPTSLHLKSQQALISYHMREFDAAERLYDEIFTVDPFRVDDIDTYSNILYVMEKRAKLAQMAQKYTALDKYRPETCCLVGNFFSLRGEHEKAIVYFRRALKLDRGYLSAWTLMGHEFVELKNTHAAVEAYRRAVDTNRKDYRAWYGLGQTYEILEMPIYALTYYQKATALRPYDARMWAAYASCFEKIGNLPEALKAYKRALLSSEPGEMSLHVKVCDLLVRLDQPSLAIQYFRQGISSCIQEGHPLQEYARALASLAQLEMMVRDAYGNRCGDLKAAETYLERLLEPTAETPLDIRDEAKMLLKQLAELQLET